MLLLSNLSHFNFLLFTTSILMCFFYPLYYTTYNTAHAASRLWRYSSIYINPFPRSPTVRVHVAAGGNIIRKSFLMMAKCRGDGREPSQRMQRAVVAVGVEPATRTKHHTKHRPQQHQEPHCLRLRLPSYHLGRPIKGNWDTKTTQCTTTWLAARPETSVFINIQHQYEVVLIFILNR